MSALTCRTCHNRLPAGTCATPELAGLAPPGAGFGIFWPPAGHAARCPAFTPMPAGTTAAAADSRPCKLTPAQADRAHAAAWPDAAIGRFQARTGRFLMLGLPAADADDLAERLHLADVEEDERRLCLECRHLAGHAAAGWRCGNPRLAGLHRPALVRELVTLMQRCGGFTV